MTIHRKPNRAPQPGMVTAKCPLCGYTLFNFPGKIDGALRAHQGGKRCRMIQSQNAQERLNRGEKP